MIGIEVAMIKSNRDEVEKQEFDPIGQPEHHLDGWVVECCHQGEEGRVREEAVLHCTPRIWMLVYV